jgi:predicted transcriptional regulator
MTDAEPETLLESLRRIENKAIQNAAELREELHGLVDKHHKEAVRENLKELKIMRETFDDFVKNLTNSAEDNLAEMNGLASKLFASIH